MNKSQLKILFFMLVLAAAAPLFAQDSEFIPPGMTKLSTDIVNIFTGPLIKGILTACLAGCGVAYGFNKDNEKMKRNIIAIVIAIGIIAGASFIVGKFFAASAQNG